MLVTIITINYNNATGLEKTIQSIVQQDYSSIEYLIIDGASSDGSVEIIRQHENQITYWISEKDNGVYHAMNKGIVKAKGNYILFINSGDYLVANDVISKIMEEEIGDVDLIYGNLERTFPDGKRDVVSMPMVLDPFFLLNASLCHPVTFIKRNLFDRYGLYDESVKIVADWAFFIKVLLAGNATYKYKSINITMFYMNGMSSLLSNQPTIQEERQKVIDLYLSPLTKKAYYDLKYYKKQYRKLYYQIGYKIELAIKKINTIYKWVAQKIYKPIIFKFRTANTVAKLRKRKKLIDYCKKIPIIINNRNRLTYLKKLIESLEKKGYENIYIIDNASDYAPLLEYYNTTPYKIFRLHKNIGHYALWDTDIYEQFKNDYYAYTDSDVEIIEECPDNFMLLFYLLLNKYSKLDKVGFSIQINDLPDHYKFKEKVINWEKQFYTIKKEKLAYKAIIDTTFALYSPHSFKGKTMFQALRTAYPYTVRHLPWYENQNELTEEQKYYYKKLQTTAHWSSLMLEEMNH